MVLSVVTAKPVEFQKSAVVCFQTKNRCFCNLKICNHFHLKMTLL